MFRRIQHVHFVGIGGSGMSGIAEVLANMGFQVSGSDLRRSDVTTRLEEAGAKVFEGHAAENVNGSHVVVRSTAVRDDNPEIVEARRRSIPVIARAEMLAELMRLKRDTVAVAGSHGKTTTTSMVATVLAHANLDPTVVVGGVVGAMGTSARLGTERFDGGRADDMTALSSALARSPSSQHCREHMIFVDRLTCGVLPDFVNKALSTALPVCA